MYIVQMGQGEWQYVPCDDIDMEALSRSNLVIHNTAGDYFTTHVEHADGSPMLRAVAQLKCLDRATDRMVLDNIGARGQCDPPGAPWAVYALPENNSSPEYAKLVAEVFYAQIRRGMQRLRA